ncbi:MAG TPA: PAS domain S-box protein, partial [Spirochaetia bacterium]|nr:PAS domain S-box protein [Spirochaetia bacterium]
MPRPPGFPHLRHLLIALAAAEVLVHIGLILFVFRGPGFSTVNDLLFPLESAGAAAAFLAAALKRRADGPRPFMGWMLVSLGFCCMAAGDLAWMILEVLARTRPFPSAGDVVYMLAYPLILAGVLCQSPAGHPALGERVARLLDAAITVSSAGLLLWITVLGPVLNGVRANGGLESAITVLYPLVDIVLLSVLIVLAFEQRWGLSPAVRGLLLASTLGQIGADSSFGLTVAFGTYFSGSPGDIGYVVSYGCAACAGILAAQGGRATPGLRQAPRGLPWQDYLPFLGGFAVVFTLLWGRTHTLPLGPFAVGAWTVAIVVLSSARQIIIAHVAARRTRELRESRDQLELRVADRTESLAAANLDLSRVVKIRNALAAELDLPVMMRTIVEEISAVVGWPCVTLYLPEPDCFAARCHVGHPAARDRVDNGSGAICRAAAGGTAARVADCAADPDFPGTNGRRLSAIVAPLLQDRQVIGVLVAERDASNAFTDSDLGLLQTIAFHASRALQSSRLFAQLRESEHRARALMDSSPDAVVITGADLRVVMANRQASALLGIPDPEQLVGKPAMDFIHPADHERVRERIALLARGGGHVSSEFLVVRPDGLTLPVETRGSLVPSPDGSPPEMIVVARDITARRIAEEELKSSHEKLERSVEERT